MDMIADTLRLRQELQSEVMRILVGSVFAKGEQDENGDPKELSKAKKLANSLNE